MYQYFDTIVKGSDNPVSITIEGFDLTTATDIEVVFGVETYTLINNPTVINVISATQLDLNLGGTDEINPSFLDIKVFTETYPRPEGFTLTNKCLGNLKRPKLCG